MLPRAGVDPRPSRRTARSRARARRAGAALIVTAALVTSGCAAGSDAAAPPAPAGTSATAPGTSLAPATVAPATAPPTTVPAWTPTTTTTPPAAPTGPCLGGAGGTAPPTGPVDPVAADAARERLAPALERLAGAGGAVGVTVRVDGVGEVADLSPLTPLVPASNQKLLVATAALELLPADTTFATTVVATGPVVAGIVQGDLVLVGGGDPTLTRAGPHSLDALAAQVQAAGITAATGNLVVDESRYDSVRTGAGWVEGAWQQSNVGLLSALVVDRNRAYADPAFAADPALVNLGHLRTALTSVGITVAGVDAVGAGSGRAGTQVAVVTSVPLPELITALLARSDNLGAELLLKEIGWRTSGVGSAAAGIDGARSAVVARCVALDGTDSDGSGLSRTDTRSPDAWRRLLEHARTRPWFATFRDALAVSGQSGTLAARLGGAETAGRVHAKTGSTAVSGALSGYLTASSGASVTFSIVVNQPRGAPEPAIDEFVTALVREL